MASARYGGLTKLIANEQRGKSFGHDKIKKIGNNYIVVCIAKVNIRAREVSFMWC